MRECTEEDRRVQSCVCVHHAQDDAAACPFRTDREDDTWRENLLTRLSKKPWCSLTKRFSAAEPACRAALRALNDLIPAA